MLLPLIFSLAAGFAVPRLPRASPSKARTGLPSAHVPAELAERDDAAALPLEAVLERAAAGESLLTALPRLFPFPLDDFQHDALAALAGGSSVVVSAPTGSGKTVIGEIANGLALCGGGVAIYTTPLKALSNQKFRDFQAAYGKERVGLLTGDNTINRDAPVLVATTEVYRSMCLQQDAAARLRNVTAVVLDEFHFMSERARGTVWEESVILTPPSVQIVALSATMSNAAQIVRRDHS
jgi:superfamily II RNA helicase